MVLMLGMICFFFKFQMDEGFGEGGEDGSIHGRVEKVSEDEKGGIGR